MLSAAICGPPMYDYNIPEIDPATFNPVEFANQFAAMQTKSPCRTPRINMALALSVFSVVSDFGLLALPIAFTLQIQLPRAKKAGVCAIFLTGLLYVSRSKRRGEWIPPRRCNF